VTSIDFYVLQETTLDARWLFACRLVDKVMRLNLTNNKKMRILIVVNEEKEAKILDDLLWTFKPESFIPHQIINLNKPLDVEITFTTEIGQHQDLLINLAQEIPGYFSRFERLSEIVIQDKTILEATRQRFSFYKQRGYPIDTKKI
jgi:DNA polymerase III subunit chi